MCCYGSEVGSWAQGRMVDRVASRKPGAWAGSVAPLPSRTGPGCCRGLVLRLWLGRTGGWKSLPLSKCVPPPTMRAAALSHLLVRAGWFCGAAGGCRWADDSVKLRSLAAAGSTSVGGAVRPVAASARIRAHLLPLAAVTPGTQQPPRRSGRRGWLAAVTVGCIYRHLPLVYQISLE